MADAGPDYSVERRKLELQRMEHEARIDDGRARLSAIERQKKVNVVRTELANAELDSEARIIETNESALKHSIADIDKRLGAMVKEPNNG